MKCTKLCIKQVLLKSFILINNINDITKWQMNNFFKINYHDLYDQWLIVIDHRLLTILNIINFSLKTTKRGFTFFWHFYNKVNLHCESNCHSTPSLMSGAEYAKKAIGYESSLTYLRKIRFNNTVHEALELWHSWPLTRVFRPSSGANIWPFIDDVLTLRNFFI